MNPHQQGGTRGFYMDPGQARSVLRELKHCLLIPKIGGVLFLVSDDEAAFESVQGRTGYQGPDGLTLADLPVPEFIYLGDVLTIGVPQGFKEQVLGDE